MRGMNKVILVGHLGRDPEVRYTPGGTAIAKVSVATSESWRDKTTGQQQEQTEWHRVVFTGDLAEAAGAQLHKGNKVMVEGALHTRKWQDKQSGQDRYVTEIKGLVMQRLDGSKETQVEAANDAHFPAYEDVAPAPKAAPKRGYAARQPKGSAARAYDLDEDVPF